jgi:hypothetical protein
MKTLWQLLIPFLIFSCTPKGPQTFSSPFIGKSKQELISSKGIPSEIKNFGDTYAYIYKSKEEYFGNIKNNTISDSLQPKKTISIEYIYYINNQNIVYKYQIWKKEIK